MNQGKYIFAQLTVFLPQRVFDRIVEKHEVNKYVKSFTCWNQMLCMLFGQLSSKDSMRDLILGLEAHSSKFYHLGLGSNVSRRNLGTANERRSFKIFEEFAYVLIAKASEGRYKSDFEVDVGSKTYALDSSTIDLCLNMFKWASFRKHKAGVKLHTVLDVDTQIPTFIYISEAKLHDVNILDLLHYEKGSFYLVDKAYIDYKRLHFINAKGAFFVTRAKSNMRFKRMYSREVDKASGIIYDQIGKLETYKSSRDYPGKIRRVKYFDQEKGKKFIFITNNMEISALDVAMLYKKR